MIKKNLHLLLKSFTIKRFANALINLLSYWLSVLTRKAIIWGYPPIVMIEPTNICNLRCPLCPSGNQELTRSRGMLDYEAFCKIIDEIAPYSFMLILWNQGEPFLNPDFTKMARYAHDKNLFLLVSTNANKLPNAKDIIHSGIDRLIVSLDGATQDTYNKYRLNGNLSIVLENVRKLIDTKHILNVKYPTIIWQFIVMKHNEHEIDEIKKLAKEIGVDQLSLKTVQIYSKEDIDNFLPTNPKYSRYKIKDNNFELKFGIQNRCRRMWTQPVINWNGEMSICCFDKDIQFPLGNVKQQTFKSLWQGEAYQQIRQIVLRDRSSIEICRNCGEGVNLRIVESTK